MKATYWQRGETLDYKNNTDTTIAENTVIGIKTRVGVTGTAIQPGQIGSLHVCGVFELQKTDTGAIEMGTLLYCDGAGVTTETDNGKTGEEKEVYVPAGYAAADASADSTIVLVKLLG